MVMWLPDGVTGRVTCSLCPNQIEGRVDGKHFYFRGRWNVRDQFSIWEFSIGDSLEEAVRGGTFSRYGKYDGWMPSWEAWDIVLRCIEEWRQDAE